MEKLKQWLDKIPTLTFLMIIIVLAFLGWPLDIEKNSLVTIALSLAYLLCVIMLASRFLNYLKVKGSYWHHIFRFFFYFFLIGSPAILFIALDSQFNLKGLLMIPALVLEAGLLIWLFIKYLLNRS